MNKTIIGVSLFTFSVLFSTTVGATRAELRCAGRTGTPEIQK